MTWDTALEFPDVIASRGRVLLHEMADYFALAHHSVGKKGTSRRTVIYPKTLFQEKQRTEINKLVREREKLRLNYCKNMKFDGEAPIKNTSFIEKVVLEYWYEKNNVQPPLEVIEFMPKLDDIGKTPDLGRLQDKIELKMAHLNRLEENHKKLKQRIAEQLSLINNQIGSGEESAKQDDENSDFDDSDKDEEEIALENMDPESRMEYMSKQLKILQEREQEAKLQKAVAELLEKENLKTFKDVPDEIKQVFTIKTESNAIEVSWDPPEDNNCQITEYSVYLSQMVVKNIQNYKFEVVERESKLSYAKVGSTKECFYRITELMADTGYYVVVTASNSNGEGYKTERPSFTRTLKDNID